MLAPLADAGAEAIDERQKRLNVLFIANDDLRPELGCYGADHVVSPNLNRLAREGVLFNRAYCQFPVCGPSRASLLSGIYPTDERFIDNQALAQREAKGCQTLPGAFLKAGYHAISNGKVFHAAYDSAGSSWTEPPFSFVNTPPDNNHLTFHDPESGQFIGGLSQLGPFFESPDVPDDTYIDRQTCDKTIGDLARLSKSR